MVLYEDIQLEESKISDVVFPIYGKGTTYKPILECDSIELKQWTLYYLPHEDNNGFRAVAITPCHFSDTNAPICDSISFCTYFDGVRHMRVNSSDAGYVNYPSGISDVLEEVNKLCEKYCLEGEWDRI